MDPARTGMESRDGKRPRDMHDDGGGDLMGGGMGMGMASDLRRPRSNPTNMHDGGDRRFGDARGNAMDLRGDVRGSRGKSGSGYDGSWDRRAGGGGMGMGMLDQDPATDVRGDTAVRGGDVWGGMRGGGAGMEGRGGARRRDDGGGDLRERGHPRRDAGGAGDLRRGGGGGREREREREGRGGGGAGDLRRRGRWDGDDADGDLRRQSRDAGGKAAYEADPRGGHDDGRGAWAAGGADGDRPRRRFSMERDREGAGEGEDLRASRSRKGSRGGRRWD